LVTPAEGANQFALQMAIAPHLLPPTAARSLDHLLDTLVTQIERPGNLPQAAPGQMHAADDCMVLRARHPDLAFRFRQPVPGGQGIPNQVWINGHQCLPECLYYIDIYVHIQ
jgi:hypothetical protein